MEATGTDDGDAARKTIDIDRNVAAGGVIVTELTVEVVAPAFNAASGGEGTGVVATRANGDDAAGETGDLDRNGAVGGYIVVAQLTGTVITPADYAAGGG